MASEDIYKIYLRWDLRINKRKTNEEFDRKCINHRSRRAGRL